PGSRNTVRIEVGPPLVVDVDSAGATGNPTIRTDRREPGLGLKGMAERVAALGGLFEAGACADGWRVQARLP
ncbi:MAG TPA: hypothetical protein VGZ52_09140, partial [Acidimicrobiales bacterium]|nr:hypothetical protein [Acidimicrobiales bacterium]